MKIKPSLFFLLALAACGKSEPPAVEPPPAPVKKTSYTNPVFTPVMADPSVLRDPASGYFFVFGTEDFWGPGQGTKLVPIARSENLVDWVYIRDAFSTKPGWKADGGIWAPDPAYVNGQYYLYYSYSVWADSNPGIGLATSLRPEGPYTDLGKLFMSSEMGVPNAIDPFYMEDGGQKYLFFGSYSSAANNGTWGVPLAADGKSVPDKNAKFKIAAGDFEGVIIEKRNDYYYFFGSKNNCCDGAASVYQVRVGRSRALRGPYIDKEGKEITQRGSGSLLIARNDKIAGPGHNARIITDDAGTDWFIYHGIEVANPMIPNGPNRRALFLDKLTWQDGWPVIAGGTPSTTAQPVPVFNKKN
ncbi:arabinan endo-1,5-alpha-L-arabinosidase [Pedobacter yulinensis]|uniref:Arabinan endo-1,5-alpha-L-arabinosidase n=1 Tax=Pedobacter yulinensis TaxID=2126353 RepID=A0A2T3HKR9_9SPHI|nr:family 43 glycosylhydrolase [Pedobacter yulinensis]PST83020.1 arabinan endo-1,5-alpha-L-arabinosidase [Pedobacter yulinensis]